MTLNCCIVSVAYDTLNHQEAMVCFFLLYPHDGYAACYQSGPQGQIEIEEEDGVNAKKGEEVWLCGSGWPAR